MPKLSSFLLFSLLLTVRAGAADLFDLVPINVPTAMNPRVAALNENGTVVGTVTTDQGWHPFLWRDGVAKFVEGIGTEAIPYGINNHDEVVGAIYTNGYYRPWLFSGGTNYILGPEPPAQQWDNAARAINDEGVVVGNVGADGFVLRPREIVFAAIGGGPCWSGFSRLTGIDKSGAVLGEMDRISVRYLSWQTPASWERRDAFEYLMMSAIGLRGSNVFGSLYGAPTLVKGTNMITLSAPAGAGKVTAMNDTGIMVGEDVDGNGLIWSGTLATKLSTLTRVPEGFRLISPIGINNAGQIAAMLAATNGNTTPVLLNPKQSPLAIQTPVISVPNKALFDTNNLSIPVGLNPAVPIVTMSYVLFSRQVEGSHGAPDCGWYPPSTNLFALSTNIASQGSLAFTLTNVSAGQYGYQAVVEDEQGAVTFGPLGYFAVSGKPRLRIQRSWFNEIEVALDGQAGLLEVLELSSNLVDWLEVTNVPPSSGTMVVETTNQWAHVAQKYYRARVVAEDADVFGYTPQFTPTPVFPVELTGVKVRLTYNGGNIAEVEFASSDKGTWTQESQSWPFTYQWKPARWTAEIQAVDWASSISFTPYRPFPGYPSSGWGSGSFRDELTQRGLRQTEVGYYSVVQDLTMRTKPPRSSASERP